VAGFVTYGRSIDDDAPPGTGQIWAIYADPDLIGLGVGAALMNAAVEGLAADGLTEATLWVLEGNAAGRRFYAKGGWLPDGASMDQPNGASPPLRDIRLRRRLP
jgi:ribosomal protein S18 acetylase RimI-like enzyme